tara:strand:- start:386 stop:1621 length:1236 start_codon:yes stop_codon:yes gene_type:complete
MKKLLILLLVFLPLTNTAQVIEYTMPFEDGPHEGTWLAWPHNFTYPPWWQEDNEPAFIEMVSVLESGENVYIIVYDENEQNHVQQVLIDAEIPLENIDFYIYQNNDYWVRDSGPIFVYDSSGNLTILDFGFNGWGEDAPYLLDDQIPNLVAADLNIPCVNLNDFVLEGGAFEIDGNGSVMLTRSSITGVDRNPDLNEAEIEDYMTTYLGVTNFIWLDGAFGGGWDITDMHIDGFVKFSDSNTIVTMSDSDLMYWGLSEQDIATLYSATDLNGNPYSFITLPLTQNNVTTSWGGNVNFKGSYVNYYVANNSVLVPIYNDPNDDLALGTIESIYPNKTVVGIDCSNMFYEGGMVHCVTQQQPISLEQSYINEINEEGQKIVKIIDILGRERTSKGFQLEIYDDGSIEKKYILK